MDDQCLRRPRPEYPGTSERGRADPAVFVDGPARGDARVYAATSATRAMVRPACLVLNAVSLVSAGGGDADRMVVDPGGDGGRAGGVVVGGVRLVDAIVSAHDGLSIGGRCFRAASSPRSPTGVSSPCSPAPMPRHCWCRRSWRHRWCRDADAGFGWRRVSTKVDYCRPPVPGKLDRQSTAPTRKTGTSEYRTRECAHEFGLQRSHAGGGHHRS